MTPEAKDIGYSSHGSIARAILWHALALAVVLLAPSELWLHRPITLLEARQVPQLLAGAMAYCCYVLLMYPAADDRRPRVLHTVLGAVMCFGLGAFLVSLRAEFLVSRGMLAMTCVLGMILANLPRVLRRQRLIAWAALATSVVVLVVAARRPAPLESTRSLTVAHQQVEVRTFRNVLSRPRTEFGGGAVVTMGKEFLLVTGSGEFYRLSFNREDSLVSEPLMVQAPMDRAQYITDNPPSARELQYRVTDIAIDTMSRPATLMLAHEYWNHSAKCFTLRVSTTPLDDALGRNGTSASWRTIFESRPCIPGADSFDGVETGGKLAHTSDGKLLLTTGDMGMDGIRAEPFAQLDGDYGKILLLDGHGGREVYTKGHRNPQGLVMSRSGRLWATEHGPRGGDEINLIDRGGNYGWPFATYGTQYDRDVWPLTLEARDRSSFVEPAHVFVPSIAITDVIELGDRQFPLWAGDLLVGAMREKGVMRVRIRGDRIAYASPIPLEHRVRDLTEASDGRVIIWTDEGNVLVLSAQKWRLAGGRSVRPCTACHEMRKGEWTLPAPGLFGIVGRRIASTPGFTYSEGLQRAGGVWTMKRLDAFLRDPNAFAPGTPMARWAIRDSTERRLAIEYLTTLK